MQVRYIAKIEVPTTTLKSGSDDQYEAVIGTGYPVRNGLVLTAWHVLFPEDRDPDKPIRVSWKLQDEQKPFHVAETFDVPCGVAEFDVALLACNTSGLDLPPATMADAGHFPVDGRPWKSFGYPTAGKSPVERIKDPANGTFQPADPDHYIQWLNVEGNVGNNDLWQGMSGAPVFDEAGLLAAVIIKTPAEYLDQSDKDNPKLLPVYKDRLVAASVPYLLSAGKCDSFREVVSQQLVAEALLPDTKLADDFNDWLADKITAELKKLQAQSVILHQQLLEELGGADEINAKSEEANGLIAEKLLDEDFEQAVEYALGGAACDCLLEGGACYSVSEPLALIRLTAENILGRLVLRELDEEQLPAVLPVCTHQSSLFFSLKTVQSLAGIEIVMARRFGRKPDFNNQYDSEQESRYRITVPNSAFKWKGEESVRRVFIEIWNQAFPAVARQKALTDSYSQKDVELLNTRLKKQRAHPRQPKHYYLSFTSKDYDECTKFISGIYHDLLSQLNEMTVIEYGSSEQESHLFVIPETVIQTTILQFYDEINGK